jgi:hypothetical protein
MIHEKLCEVALRYSLAILGSHLWGCITCSNKSSFGKWGEWSFEAHPNICS